MNEKDPCYAAYVQILREELVPAMGCTEPIAIAYAAAKARQVLGALPERMEVAVSGNIIKNVKSVSDGGGRRRGGGVSGEDADHGPARRHAAYL